MAVATYLKFALFVSLILVEGFEVCEISFLNCGEPEDTLLMTVDSRENMEVCLQKFKPCVTHNLNRPTHFSQKPEKRGNKAALLDMVDYMNVPGSASDGIKPQAQFMRAWKNILKQSK